MAMKEDREIPLAGGRQTPGIVRIDDTVRRTKGPNAPFVHKLLRYLEVVGFDGAPRLLGIDDRGREVLSFVGGEVPHDHDEIQADLRRARANHERAGRLKARDIFQVMIDWMDTHASELKKLG
jgi:hypothetical protein